MEIIKKTIVRLLILLCLLCISCSSGTKKFIDAAQLYQDFYEMNKENDFEGLYNLDILGIRDEIKFNPISNKYILKPSCIGIRDSFGNFEICLPFFSKDANKEEIRASYSRLKRADSIYLINKYKETDSAMLFNNYTNEVKTINSNYEKIKVPNSLPQANIKIRGHINYIVFYLYENKEEQLLYRCYYLKDTTVINKKNNIDFRKKSKIDSNWYHDVIYH